MPQARSPNFERAIALIDAENARDPNPLAVDDRTGPRELLQGEMLMGWMERLLPTPSEELLLAARAHHVGRWQHARSEFPAGRGGYLRWRTNLYRVHAETAARLAGEAGYPPASVVRVHGLVQKKGRTTDSEAQAFEDGLCLVFLETQLNDLIARLEPDHMVEVLRKTARKMSPAALRLAANLSLDPEGKELLERALAP